MAVADAPSAAMAMRGSNRRPSSSSTNMAPAIRPTTLKYQSHQVRDTRTHLHAWAFTAEGKPGADRQQSAKEFHHNQPNWLWRQFLLRHRLNLRDATPRGVRRK